MKVNVKLVVRRKAQKNTVSTTAQNGTKSDEGFQRHAESDGALHGMYGSMEAEFQVQRTIKRTELTAFLCLLRKVFGPIKIHVENKGIIDGLRRGEKESITPRAGDADLWIKMLEELHELVKKRHLGGSGTCEGTPYEE